MSERAEFTKATKLAAFQRNSGRCYACEIRLAPGNIEYHHDKECAFGGGAALGNCIVLCRNCHGAITKERAPVIAKSTRVRNRHIGIKRRTSRPLPGTRASGWRHKMSGEWVRR